MKSTVFGIFALAAATLVAASPIEGINKKIPVACKVCDLVGAPCVAACIAGGPADPFCDICAGPEVWECVTCLASN